VPYFFIYNDRKNAMTTETLQELENLSQKAAGAARIFFTNDMNLERYKQFLNTMYHYTERSGEMISYAGKFAHTDELKHFFDYMLKEEKGHYLLAKEDLKALGGEVSETIPHTVSDFHSKWFSLSDNIYAYLGAIYVFENIAKHLHVEGKALFDLLGLTKTQKRWIAVHLEADLDHGAEIAELCERYTAQNPEACSHGGRVMCDAWINVFTQREVR
jgi:hypothetical protein